MDPARTVQTESNEVLYEVADHIAAITLNAPERMNTISGPRWRCRPPKRLMRMGLNETFPDHVHHVYLQLLPLFKTQDMQEGIRAFKEKREAKFEGR